MKLRKTTAALLIAIFMISTFAVVVPVSAATLYVGTGGYSTIQAAIDDASDYDIIIVGPGDWFGAIVDKDIEIRGEPGAKIVYDPNHVGWQFGLKLVSGSEGATISYLTFQGVELPIYGKYVDGVTVEHNKIYDTCQGITNWDGDNWVIRHNRIEGIAVFHNGGGIGICVGSIGGDVSGNYIAHNRIVAYIPGSFTFSVGGILLCTDERKVPPGIVSDNKIVHNKVKITAEEDDSWAIGLQLIPPTGQTPIGTLRDNLVGFNDLRGSDFGVSYYPDDDTLRPPVNTVSRNLGEDANRGHGVTPADIFDPT